MYVVKVKWTNWILEDKVKDKWSGTAMTTVYLVLNSENEISAIRKALSEFELKTLACDNRKVEIESIEVESWKGFDGDVMEVYENGS